MSPLRVQISLPLVQLPRFSNLNHTLTHSRRPTQTWASFPPCRYPCHHHPPTSTPVVNVVVSLLIVIRLLPYRRVWLVWVCLLDDIMICVVSEWTRRVALGSRLEATMLP